MPYNFTRDAGATIPSVSPYLDGQYYSAWGTAANAATGTRRVLVVAPIVIPVDLTIDALAVRVNAASDDPAALFRPVIYESNVSGMPGDLLAIGADIALGSGSGVREVAADIALEVGVYWLGGFVVMGAANTAPSLYVCSGTPPYTVPYITMDAAINGAMSVGISGNGGAPLASDVPPATFANPAGRAQAWRVGYRVQF